MLEKLKTENNRKIIIVLLALFVTIAFSLKLDIVNNSDISEITSKTNYFVKLLFKFDYSIDKDIFKSFLLFALLIMFFKKAFFRDDIEKQGKKVFKVILALLFSFFMVFGYSYYKINSWDMIFENTFQLFKATIVFIGYYILFRAIINYLFDILFPKISTSKLKETTNKVYNFIFIKHSFIMPLVIILICWLPYLIAYYPGILGADQSNQVKQFLGYDIPEWSASNSNKLIDENVKITNHHPVLHTIGIGLCAKLGLAIGNVNFGIFIFTLMQYILLGIALANIINFMKKLKVPYWIKVFSLLLFALSPTIAVCSVQVNKDVIFASLMILYVIRLYELIKSSNNKKLTIKNCIGIIILSLLVCLFRNNGIYAIVLSLPFVAIIDKLNRKQILISSITVLIIYQLIISVILPLFKIPNSGIREMLSVPFQQTARYVKEHGEEVTEEEKQIIDKILDYDTLAERYDPLLSDPVKRDYNKDATTEDLINYFKVWFAQFLKHPTTYIQATMNNVYGYFYPETNLRQYNYYMVNSIEDINEIENFDYGYIDELQGERHFIKGIASIITKFPGISWTMNIAFNVWLIMIIFVYLIYSKKNRYIIYLLPFISIILVCILSPVNAAYRYSISFIFGMPLTVAIFIDILKQKQEDKNVEEKIEK